MRNASAKPRGPGRHVPASAAAHHAPIAAQPPREFLRSSCAAILLLTVWASPSVRLTAAETDGSPMVPVSFTQADLDDLPEESAGPVDIHVKVLEQGTSLRRVRRTAIDELPLNRMTPPARQCAQGVLDGLSLHRRLPIIEIESDRRVLQFFLAHPDVAVAIWQAMDITEMQLKAVAPGRYSTDSGDGTTGVISVLYADQSRQLIHCEGLFKSPVLARPIHAQALMYLQVEYPPPSAPHQNIRCTTDVYVNFPSTTVETAVRVISPLSYRIADRNFEEVAMFIRMMHIAMTRQPGWVEQVSTHLTDVSDERRNGLLDVTAHVYVDAQRRLAQQERQTLTPEDLRLPIRREPEVKASSRPPTTQPPTTAQQPAALPRR